MLLVSLLGREIYVMWLGHECDLPGDIDIVIVRINVLDRGNIENDDEHCQDQGHQKGSVQFEDCLAVKSEHIKELGMDKESVSQPVRVDPQAAEVGHDHDRDQAIQDITLGVVGDDGRD